MQCAIQLYPQVSYIISYIIKTKKYTKQYYKSKWKHHFSPVSKETNQTIVDQF